MYSFLYITLVPLKQNIKIDIYEGTIIDYFKKISL